MKNQSPYQFFLQHAEFSWNPATETREQGKRRCAKELAKAEQEASKAGVYFRWETDGRDSSDWSDDEPVTPTWGCIAFDSEGVSIGSLCGVDFGDGSPQGSPYRRVVEAEIALEALATV